MSLFLGVCTLLDGLEDPLEVAMDVPSGAIPLGYPDLEDDFIACCLAKGVDVDPRYLRQDLLDLVIGCLIPLFVAQVLG